MKYEVVQSVGCLSYGITINGKEWSGEYEPTLMSDNEREEFVDFLLQEFKKQLKECTVTIDDLLNLFQYETCETERGSCDQCGDSVTTTTWKFE